MISNCIASYRHLANYIYIWILSDEQIHVFIQISLMKFLC